jgi:hypothetical protein
MLARAFLLGVILLMSGLLAWSQQPPTPKFYAVEEEVIDPALTEPYEQGIKLMVEAMRKAKLGPEWNWGASHYGQSYFYVFTVSSLGDVDPQSSLMRQRGEQLLQAVGKETFDQFERLTSPAIQSDRLSVMEPMEAHSYRPAKSVVKESTYRFVEVHRVRADMLEQYKAVLSRYVAAMRAADYPLGWSAYRIIVGEGRSFYGQGRTFYYVLPFDSMSQFYEQYSFGAALEKALGKEGAKQLVADQMKCLAGLAYFDTRRRADLSYVSLQNK